MGNHVATTAFPSFVFCWRIQYHFIYVVWNSVLYSWITFSIFDYLPLLGNPHVKKKWFIRWFIFESSKHTNIRLFLFHPDHNNDYCFQNALNWRIIDIAYNQFITIVNVIHFSLTLWINIWYKLLLVFIFPTFLSWRTVSAFFGDINHIHLDFQKKTQSKSILTCIYIYTYMISSASLYLIKYKKRFGFATSHRTKKKMQSRQTLQLFQLGYWVLWSLAPCHGPVINGGITCNNSYKYGNISIYPCIFSHL